MIVSTIAVSVVIALSARSQPQAPLAQTDIEELANRYVAIQLEETPPLADFSGLPGREDLLPDISDSARAQFYGAEDALWSDVTAINASALRGSASATYAILKEALGDDIAMRVCRRELWSVDHLFGWQVSFPQAAEAQPTATPEERVAALARWSSLPRYLKQDEDNLRAGLRIGYSAPQSVVLRVIKELDELLSPAVEESRFYSPAARSGDHGFQQKIASIVRYQINPAIQRYRSFLAEDYLPHARVSLGVSALPSGRECYAASLRKFTTLPRSAEETYALGAKAVAVNEAQVIALGKIRFGSSDLAAIYRLDTASPDNKFNSASEFLNYEKAHLLKNENASRPYFPNYPKQAVTIDPIPQNITEGPPPHYEPEPDIAKPGRYVLPLSQWASTSRGAGEILSVHEAVPGHHIQISIAFQRLGATPISKIAMNAAFTEGWARYAENFAEEIGLYQTDYAKIERRSWPAHGMVLDPGIHVFNWTRDHALTYLKATGQFDDEQAAAMLDRIAVIPGQLTAYDTGGLELLALRKDAEIRLGSKFDLSRFHQTVLEEGAVPLIELRQRVEAWIVAGGN